MKRTLISQLLEKSSSMISNDFSSMETFLVSRSVYSDDKAQLVLKHFGYFIIKLSISWQTLISDIKFCSKLLKA